MVNHPRSTVLISIRFDTIRHTTKSTDSNMNITVSWEEPEFCPPATGESLSFFIILVFYEVASTRQLFAMYIKRRWSHTDYGSNVQS